VETFLRAFSTVLTVLFFFGVLGCLFVIPETAWALLMSAFETPDQEENSQAEQV
jgi:hypothetical protein